MRTISLSTTSGDVRSFCPTIDDAKAREWDEREARRKRVKRLMDSGIPSRYRDAAIEDCDPAVMEYAESGISQGAWLVLSGPNGTGKTHQACAVANRFMETSDRSVRFASMGKVLGELYDAYGTSERSEAVLYRYSKCQLLVLDDFGKERLSANAADKLFRIIDERWANEKPTVITTNLTSKGLRESLTNEGGDEVAKAVIDRIADRRNVFVRLDGRSMRR